LRVRVQLSDWRQAEWSLNDVRLRLPLDVLQGLGTPWNTLQLQGQMQLRSAGLSGRAGAVQGQVTLNTEQVASRLSTVRPLGDYEATITWPQQELPQVKLRTLDGHLRLQGQGQIAQGRLRFRGQASASPDSAGALSNLLNIIGRRQGAISILTIG
jgi:general secretion pathway protein N